ncbi:MAG TPA: hypothetical protein VHX65_10370 [Pirellulales bacterium]|jgi:hypothetical protein|nr:hypothetical protein [Pirellulales bacterium]
MTPSERSILACFRRYQAGPDKMLFLNPADCKMHPGPFRNAMMSLIRQSLVVKERPKAAYSLTRDGYDISVLIVPAEAVLRAAPVLRTASARAGR